MIIELFGPPGVGKTTFAQALVARLRRTGRDAYVRLSSRPGEANSGCEDGRSITPRFGERMGRLSRPMFELAPALAFQFRSKSPDPSTDRLVSLLPPGHPLAALRMRQYLVRLSAAWRAVRDGQCIVIFDQGYIQAVSSILLASRRIDENDVAKALSVAPCSDLAVRVLAPAAEIARRLDLRAQALGGLGRLLKFEGRQRGRPRASRRLLAKRIGANRSRGDRRPIGQRRDLRAGAPTRAIGDRNVSGKRRLKCADKNQRDELDRLRAFIRRRAANLATIGIALAIVAASPSPAQQRTRVRHFTPNANFYSNGTFLPSKAGFDLADVSTLGELDRLPEGTMGLFWVGQCSGASTEFRSIVEPVIDHSKLFGFYIMDDPDPTGRWRPLCTVSDLRA